MPIAVDSTTAVQTSTSTTVATVQSASFTPPAGSVVYVFWGGNTSTGNPGTPTITDSLASHQAWSLRNWRNLADASGRNGQCALWRTVIGAAPGAMTVTVTTGSPSGDRQAAVQVIVLTGVDTTTPEVSDGEGSDTGGALDASSYTSGVTGSLGIQVASDWDTSSSTFTAASGTTLLGSSTCGGSCNVAMMRQTTTANSGTTVAMGLTSPTSTTWNYVRVEVRPAAGATATPAAIAGVVTIPAGTVLRTALVAGSAITGAVTIPAVTVLRTALVPGSAITGVATIPGVTVAAGSNATVTPAAIAGVVTLPASTAAAASTANPAALAGSVSLPTVTVSTGGATSSHTGFADGDSTGLTYDSDTGAYTLWTACYANGRADASAAGVRIYVASGSGAGGTGFTGRLAVASGGGNGPPNSTLETKAFGTVATDAWTSVMFDTPHLMADQVAGTFTFFWVGVDIPAGHYSYKANAFGSPIQFHDLTGVWLASNAETTPGNASFGVGSGGQFPTGAASSNGWYGIDPIVMVPSSGDATATPSAIAGAVSIPSAAVLSQAAAASAAVAGAVTIPAGTVTSNAVPAPAAILGQVAIPAATLHAGSAPTPAAIAGVVSMPAVTVTTQGNATSTPAAIVGAVTMAGVTASGTAKATPSAIAGAVSMPAVTVHLSALPAPAAISGSVTMPVFAALVSVTILVDPILGAVTMPAVTVTTGSSGNATPAAIAGQVSIPAVTVTAAASTTATPAAISGAVTFPPVTVHAGTTPTPAAITGTVTIGAVTVTAGATAAPAVILGAVVMPTATVLVQGSATATPSAIAGVVTIPGGVRVTVAVPPFTVTGTDRPLTAVTGTDRAATAVTASDRPQIVVTSG